MQTQDMRTWLPASPYDPSVAQPCEETVVHVSSRVLRKLLDSAAFSGTSAFIDSCFDFESKH